MNSSKLSEDTINQIKGFVYYELDEAQKSLIDELIPNEELRERYKEYGLCKECSQPNTGYGWCQSCNSKHFQQDFNKWTSGNKEIDEFVQKFQLYGTCKEELLEWIPYGKIMNIEYLADGGFCRMYKGQWIDGHILEWDIDQNKWKRANNDKDVALKCLNNSQNLITDFLQEISFHKNFVNSCIVSCYGISQDPLTKNFIMVMQYIPNGNIRQFLKSNYNSLSFSDKLSLLKNIANGLTEIHNKGFIHRDLNAGKILSYNFNTCYISGLGLCEPAVAKQDEKKIYGVLPYVAPEVLRGKAYTKAADIYSFGVLACEILSGLPPYHEFTEDEYLAIKICQGLRPKSNNIKVPLLLEKLIDQCLDEDLLIRPTASELKFIIEDWYKDIICRNESEIYKQFKELEEINN